MCALCSAAAGTDLICASCRNALPTLGPACPGCALPSTTGSACGRCLADPPAYDATRAAYIYAFPLDRLVQAFKYNGALSFAAWFAEAMGNLRGVAPVADLMVAMPLSANRQRERGFNHALEIARPLAVRTGIRLAAHAVTRVRDTAAQATLPWSERARNVHFEDHIENGEIHFDYHLRPGVVERSNALELMRAVGLDV